jgi:hypothetical protein
MVIVEPEPLPKAEHIVLEPKQSPLTASVFVGGCLALSAQAYLWGTVFVTLFKATPRPPPPPVHPASGPPPQEQAVPLASSVPAAGGEVEPGGTLRQA